MSIADLRRGLLSKAMTSQEERRAATRKAVLDGAARLFAQDGFASTTMDQIAAAAGVAKGAVYHHFASKEALFEAVLVRVSAELSARVAAVAAGSKDFIDAVVTATAAYFAFCAEPPLARIVLKDGPAVLGWERWREIDSQSFAAALPARLEQAMAHGVIARQPAAPLARLIVGAVTEAAVACAASDDPARTGREHALALESLLGGLRVPPLASA
jgi:AcrR family transcriptional regulator